jgi:hypothetical protein
MFVFVAQVKFEFNKQFFQYLLNQVSVIEHRMIDLFNGKRRREKISICLLIIYRYKIIDSVRSALHPHGPFTKESAVYICNELNIDNDVVYGNTKLFIKQP